MVKHDDKTIRGWPLPHRENRLYDDVERLREALNLVDEALTAIETHEGTIEGRQDSLSTRLDTILEGATEDSEILDARVDAEDEVHPNLGHNIRNLHRLIRELNDALDYKDTEFQGLLRQFGSLAEAQILYELNEQDAHARRKADISREVQARAVGDLGLARQADINAQSSIRNALNLADEAAERRKVRASLDSEIQNRTEYDSQQDAEISRNAGSIEAEAR